METSVFQDVNKTPEDRLKGGDVTIQKEIIPKDEPITFSEKEKVMKKFAKLPKRKKRSLIKRLLDKRIRLRRLSLPQQKTTVTFEPTRKPAVMKTRQPSEPSFYFKQSENVPSASFIGKYRVK